MLQIFYKRAYCGLTSNLPDAHILWLIWFGVFKSRNHLNINYLLTYASLSYVNSSYPINNEVASTERNTMKIFLKQSTGHYFHYLYFFRNGITRMLGIYRYYMFYMICCWSNIQGQSLQSLFLNTFFLPKETS